MAKTKPKIGFLFGAGVSRKAGMPTTKGITDEIILMRKNQFIRHYFQEPAFIFLNYVFEKCRQYFKRDVTYEDIYYVIDQMCEEKGGDLDSPAVELFGKECEKYFWEHIAVPHIPRYFRGRGLSFSSFLDECRTSIKKTLSLKLTQRPIVVSYFHLLDDILKNVSDGLDIFTLNHDKVIETYFSTTSKYGKYFTDGFEENKDRGMLLNFDSFKERKYKAKLYKLHGSMDWFWVKSPYIVVKTDKQRNYNCKFYEKAYRNEVWDVTWDEPLLLIGTFNKMLHYTQGIFLDFLSLFSGKLDELDWLIISGYSFSDKGINNVLIEKVYRRWGKLKILIIDPDVEKLLARKARSAVQREFKIFKGKELCFVLEKCFENITLSDVKV